MAMLQRNIERLQWLLIIVVIIVVLILPIVVPIIVRRIADGRLVVVVIVARARARQWSARGHRASGARSFDDGKIAHAGGMRRF